MGWQVKGGRGEEGRSSKPGTRVNRQTDGRTEAQGNEKTDVCVEGGREGQRDGEMDGVKVGGTDGWMDGWMDRVMGKPM